MPLSNNISIDSYVRFLHWNIHSWQGQDGTDISKEVGQALKDIDPEIVSLVEVDELWGTPERLASVAESLGYAWIFSPTFEFGDRSPRGGFGNALLAKLPILAVQQWQLLWPTRVYDGTESSEQRSTVLAKLDCGDQGIWVGSTHLPRQDEIAKADALKRLLYLTGRLTEPWALCGDFNIPPTAWINTDQSISYSPDPPIPTYPTGEPMEPIDYCIGPSDALFESEVLTVFGSDHLPILTKFWLNSD